MDASAPIVFPLTTADASAELVGGKGLSLAKLAASGLPVPGGFLVSTQAYQRFVDENNLGESIGRIVDGSMVEQAGSLELASAGIRTLFEAAKLPSEMVASIAEAYAVLGEGEPAVAVRSSATAEDLPDFSFAGQHDTFLNVRGEAAVLEAICGCWASLWTARAIGYRKQMHIDSRTVAMGVVVQAMVLADVSGILFTANPANGDRNELVINASFGLGEAVVGGDVTPDTFVLDRGSLKTNQAVVGTKDSMIVPASGQGTTTQPVSEARRETLSLAKEILHGLARLCLDAERLFEGVPQDIEWAVADGQCWLLQSRPITNLPAPPLLDVTWDPPTKGAKLIRRQVVENMPEPLSPLFEDLYLYVGLEQAIDQFLVDFGMEFDLELFLERPFFLTVNGYAYCRGSYRWSWRLLMVLPKILYSYSRIVPKLLRNMKDRWQDEALPAYLNEIERWRAVDLVTASASELRSGVRALSVADAIYWFSVSILVGAAKVTDGLLNQFVSSRMVPGKLTSGMFLRGFPSRTIEAQIELETIAQGIRRDEVLCALVRDMPARDLLDALRVEHEGRSPARDAILRDVDRYFERYGHQVYNLDFVEPTQAEDPAAVLYSLKALVSSDTFDTPTRQAALVGQRNALIERTLASLGPLRRWLFRKLLRWAENFAPWREEALFYMGAAWTTLRPMALELGRRLVETGTLTCPDDVFYLKWAELEAAILLDDHRAGTHSDFDRLAGRRRELRETRKRLHPPGIIPPGSRWKIGLIDMTGFESQKRNADNASTLMGFAVSPGRVTGVATVIHSPADFDRMKPDTILVCPTTTPAWTPLFAQARGLVTDIGGILAHGSIVAREYGIPAVLGTGNATQRILHGQRITVDGDTGEVSMLE